MIVLLGCLLVGEAFPQKYSTALGARLSKGYYGVTMKQRVFKTFAVEAIAAGSDREMTGTLLLEKHLPVIGKGLSAYVGAGGHIGGLEGFGTIMGADALFGVEMKLPFMPLVVSADFKPTYQIIHEDRFDTNTAISVRYIIGKETKKQRQHKREKKKRKKVHAKEKKQRLKAREKRREEKAKQKKDKEKQKQKEQKNDKRKGKDKNKVEEKKSIFQDIHLLKIFKKEEPSNDKKKKNSH